MRCICGSASLAVILQSAPASAHSFGKLYNLPVPLWMYLYGSAAALVLSFLIIGYFVSSGGAQHNERSHILDPRGWSCWLFSPTLKATLRALSVISLALAVCTGLFGTQNAYNNFSMTWFWILFVLGLPYLTALTGNFYALINPWKVLTEWAGGLKKGLFAGRWQYPIQLDYYPALVFYMLFIWIELYGYTKPYSLALILIGYTFINVVGAYLWGATMWFRYCEMFSVMLRLIGLMAPLERAPAGSGSSYRLRHPFMGLLRKPAESYGMLLFILFMLSSTAYDGLHSTVPWVRLYWKHLYQFLLPYAGGDMLATYPLFQAGYKVWHATTLALSPFVYLAIYLLFVRLAKSITHSEISVRDLSLHFAHSLLPIVLVYHVTHYYTLLQTQAPEIVRLLSDPFGWGWNLFGTANWRLSVIPDAGTVWHVQVWLILLGHIVSVYLAHLQALRIFPSQRQATLSQIPMLILMVVFTAGGLWILSQPITNGQVIMPIGSP